ncbi:MAG: ComEC/Rec2 family competence protein [Holosporales bacterium]|jgi:competence protein ComEC|nr:ComEC/Rec2 family competence protein [Holosporales bacterium]
MYIAQTGGILETSLLSSKRFIEKEIDKIAFFADVGFIEISHPTMKNMQRITLKNIEFQNSTDLQFIKNAKMTIASSIVNKIAVNDRIKVIGKLMPYKTAAIPMAFDQAQYNALIKMDASGIVFYAKKINSGDKDFFTHLRMRLTNFIVEKMGKDIGGVASALLTGDKSSISPAIRASFINSGTAHILAISGFHMSLIASIFFFIFLKIGLYLRLQHTRKFAALITIILTYLYLALSGFSPSAIRAFIMTTVCLIGIILGKGSVSMRSISLAAFIILLFDPASLFLVSFQLSFCAVTALISFYEKYKNHNSKLHPTLKYITASLITTIIASIATFPISVATFNRYSGISGLLGNLIAMPLTSIIIMPLGIICLVFGGFYEGLIKILKTAIKILIECVSWVSTIPGSSLTIKSPQIETLYILIIGGIILCVLQTKLRSIGAGLIGIATLLWIFEKKPNLIIPPDTSEACLVKEGEFYVTSLQKARNKFLAIQRNLGLSGKLNKIDKRDIPIELKRYEQGLFCWIENGKITKTRQIAKRKHPYCPAVFA